MNKEIIDKEDPIFWLVNYMGMGDIVAAHPTETVSQVKNKVLSIFPDLSTI